MESEVKKPPLLEKWGSVAKIRRYYSKARANLQELAAEERQKLVDLEEATVEAYKTARSGYTRDKQREKEKLNQRARRKRLREEREAKEAA